MTSPKNQKQQRQPASKKGKQARKPKAHKNKPPRTPRNPRTPRPSRSCDTPPSQPLQPDRWREDSVDDLPTGNAQLRFTPEAWAKLVYFCHAGDTEIGGFGLSHPDDPLLVIDFLTLKQTTTAVSVEFDDEAVADLFEEQVDLGHRPEQFARIWCHTHPGSSPDPSMTDEETFAEVFGRCDWAVMFILAKGGQTYARLRFNTGPGGAMLIGVAIDYHQTFGRSDHEAWAKHYEAHIHPAPGTPGSSHMGTHGLFGADEADFWDPVYGWYSRDEHPDAIPGALDLEHDDQIEQLMAAYGVDDIDDLHAMLELESNTSYEDEVTL